MDNLQTEVLELEFNEFSKGMQTISEIEFARILLRYTIFGRDEHEQYLTRLAERMPQEKVRLTNTNIYLYNFTHMLLVANWTNSKLRKKILQK